MNHQHKMTRNQTSKGSVVWKILQFAFFAVACIWLLYQMRCSFYISGAKDCDYGESKLREVHRGKMLGRKGNLGSSHDPQGLKLSESSNLKGKGEEETIDDSALQSRFLEEVSMEKKADSPRGELGNEMLIAEKLIDEDHEEVRKRSEREVKPNVNFGGVILKTDENGVLKRDSSPSRRSDIESNLRGNTSSNFGNRSSEMRACEKIILQDILKKQSLKKFQPKKAVHESEKGSKRELLFTKRWLNISGF